MTKNLKNEFYGTQVADLHEMKNYVFTSRGKSIFFAGKEGNWERAEAYAKAHNMKQISKTHGGKSLKTLQSSGVLDYATRKGNHSMDTKAVEESKRSIWNSASRRYAAAVEGKVRTYVCGARPDSIFRKTELPTLLNNKNVKQINGISRHALNEFRRQTFTRLREQGISQRQAAAQTRDAVHRKVAIAEIRCDLKQAAKTNDKALYNDCQKRFDNLRQQTKAETREKTAFRQQEKSEIRIMDRIKTIHDRAYNQGLQKGMPENIARIAADMRAKHVTERYALNKMRAEAFINAKEPAIKSWAEQRQNHRQCVIRDHQELAITRQQPYKGPALMPDKFREIDTQIKTREMHVRAQLEKNYRDGNISAREYKSLGEKNESILSQSRQRDLSSYFQAQQNTQAQAQAQKTQNPEHGQTAYLSPDTDAKAEAASYGYNYTLQGTTISNSQNHSQNALSQMQPRSHTH